MKRSPDDPQGKRFVGSVLSGGTRCAATPAVRPKLAVRADIEVAGAQVSVTFSLPATPIRRCRPNHTIEIVFTLRGLVVRRRAEGARRVDEAGEQTRGVPLAGLRSRYAGIFLIGCLAGNRHAAQSAAAQERSWFDIPIIYNNNRRAILAMEKGTPGEQAFNQAFARGISDRVEIG